MNAMVLEGIREPLVQKEIPNPIQKDGYSIVRLAAAALNKRDYWITVGKYPGLKFPVVLGSDGSGWLHDEPVIIDPSLDWGSDPEYFQKSFRILGFPDQGTLAEYVAVPSGNIHKMPAHLSMREAAALPVCGVTAYRSIFTRGRAKPGERMLVTGAGGGVATLAIQFGVAHGLEVWVTSSSLDKIQLSKTLGANGGVLYTKPDWEKELQSSAGGGIDLVIDGAGGEGISRLVNIMNPRGRIIMYGGTVGMIDGLSPQRIFWKQLDIMGSTMGSPEDFSSMLSFVEKHSIVPVVGEVFQMNGVNEGIALLASGKQNGKVIIDIYDKDNHHV